MGDSRPARESQASGYWQSVPATPARNAPIGLVEAIPGYSPLPGTPHYRAAAGQDRTGVGVMARARLAWHLLLPLSKQVSRRYLVREASITPFGEAGLHSLDDQCTFRTKAKTPPGLPKQAPWGLLFPLLDATTLSSSLT